MKVPYPIRSIQKGSDHPIWFRVGERNIASIEEELKPVSWGKGESYEMIVYRCYDKDRNLLCEIETDSSLAIFYGTVDKKPDIVIGRT